MLSLELVLLLKLIPVRLIVCQKVLNLFESISSHKNKIRRKILGLLIAMLWVLPKPGGSSLGTTGTFICVAH